MCLSYRDIILVVCLCVIISALMKNYGWYVFPIRILRELPCCQIVYHKSAHSSHGLTVFDTLFWFWFQQLFRDISFCNLFLWPSLKRYPLWSSKGGFLSSRFLGKISNRQPYATNLFSACTSALPTSKKKWTETSFHSGGASISEIKRYSLGYEFIAQSIEGSTMFE